MLSPWYDPPWQDRDRSTIEHLASLDGKARRGKNRGKKFRAEVPYADVIALAHCIVPALVELEVEAHNPVQGEAMHKVIGYHASKALERVGWLSAAGSRIPDNGTYTDEEMAAAGHRRLYVVTDPGPQDHLRVAKGATNG